MFKAFIVQLYSFKAFETPDTLRAGTLRSLYLRLKSEDLIIDKRLNVLVELKSLVLQHQGSTKVGKKLVWTINSILHSLPDSGGQGAGGTAGE